MGEPQTNADWYPDPMGRHEMRYFDGTQWTEHVADRGQSAVDPLTQAPSTQAAGPVRPGGQAMPFQAVEYTDIAVRLDPQAARDAAVAELTAHGFRLSFPDPWNAIAERGSKGMNVVFGAFAQYYCVGFTVFTGSNGETVVRLLRAPTDYFTGGGVIGKARTSGEYGRIANEMIAAFTAQGVLVEVQHA